MSIQTIQFGDEGQLATRELMQRFERLPEELAGAEILDPLRERMRTLDAIDRQYGSSARLPLEDAAELVAATLSDLAHLDRELERRSEAEWVPALADIFLGVTLWALRHEVPITVPEPVVNALAVLSNSAASRQDLAAAFGLMQGMIANLEPLLGADLERSNPERPWRILHINYAITAIRTEDPLLMVHAFDALDRALPDECAGFYAEALALAMGPRVAPEVRQHIETRHRRWNTL